MKVLRHCLIALLIWLLVIFSWPMLFKHSQQTIKTTPVSNDSQTRVTKQTALKVQGPARFINRPASRLERVYGPPTKQVGLNTGQSRWLFNLDTTGYLEATIDETNQTVMSLLVIGHDNRLQPFAFKQHLNKIRQQAPIPKRVRLTLHEVRFELALSKQQQARQPLLTFKNGTYLVLNLVQGRVQTAFYGNSAAILALNLYQVMSKTPLPALSAVGDDLTQIDQDRQVALTQSLMGLRASLGQEPVSRREIVPQATLQTLQRDLQTQPKQVLTPSGYRRFRQFNRAAANALVATSLTTTDFRQSERQSLGLPAKVAVSYWTRPIDSQRLMFELQPQTALYQRLASQNTQALQLACLTGHTILLLEYS